MPPFAWPVLVADIGGTNCRLSLVEQAGAQPVHLARIATGSQATPEAALESVLATLAQRPRSAILAVAGPLEGRTARLTNANWTFDGPGLGRALGLEQGLLVNDFEAQAASLAVLGAGDVTTLVAGEPEAGGTRLVLGPGTGFGAAALVTRAGRSVLVPTEAGHIGIGPEDPTEEKIWPALAAGLPRVTVESLLSGDGLVRFHRAVADSSGLREPDVSAADVTTLALDGEPAALMAVICFWRLLARVAGDLALAFKATGGVYLSGGIVPRLLPLAERGAIRSVFAAKPPMEDLAARFSLHVITAGDGAERGMAAIAAAPERFGLDDPARLWFG
ncbi:MAG TPA: glucokinase [Bosea sp. (in: a-proteobacteria)]|jgi:glucokinase|uniref:glucokinase n=1 Tax=Bosea sp. (in: a-proteobacteria) TaxID=1871050 RepID=UPI002DDD657E|nr:glucokinase [Bosea sp. (in: a-proteobacteria)]HEV2552800.1 glucokinase [Bosea sp. (in: a-proteobacteria)]